ncbi:hypothetical protein U9224_23930, partial [Escherichia coli]
MLEHFGAEASVLDMTIIVRSNPSKAAILEEFLHGTQEKLGIAEKLGRYGLGSAETHVKDFMIRHKKMLGLSDEDVAILKILKDKCVFRSIRSRIGIEVRSAIRIHSINRELNFFYRFLTRFFAAFH